MVLLDGAMGTELQRRGLPAGLPLWSAQALLDRPDLVLQIHREYAAAGADVLTANTFRTTRRTFLKAGLTDRSGELTELAVSLARQSSAEATDRHVLVAGSMAPLEDCYRPDLVPSEKELAREHALHAEKLARAGVDLLLCETMGTVREAAAACRAAVRTGRKTIVSFLCTPEATLYSGEPLAGAVATVEPLKPVALSLNCLSPRFMERAILVLKAVSHLPWGVYGNVGVPGGERQEEGATSSNGGLEAGDAGSRRASRHNAAGLMACDIDAEAYTSYAERWAELGASFLGGCCGTTPDYIRKLRQQFPRGVMHHDPAGLIF